MKRDKRTNRRSRTQHQGTSQYFRRFRRLGFESLEDRRLLTASIGGRVWSDTVSDGIRQASEPSLPGVAVQLIRQDQTQRSQAFDTNPNWTSANNTSNGNNFSFRNSNNTSGNPAGELGGTFARTASVGYVADTSLGGTLTLNDPMFASGEFIATSVSNFNNGVDVGHFGTSTDSTDSTRANFVGFGFGEDQGAGNRIVAGIWLSDGGLHPGNEITGIQLNVPYTWTYSYDPDFGNGRLTAQIFGSTGLVGASILDLSAADRIVGASLDAFGISTGGIGEASSTNRATTYIDNLSYSLVPTANALVASTTSDANGGYAFSGLSAGRYAVAAIAPAGYQYSLIDQGNDDTLDSDIDASTQRTVVFPLAATQSKLDIDAGFFYLNQPPVNTTISTQSVNEDTALVINGISISDVDAGTASVSVTLSVASGTLTVSSNAVSGVTSGVTSGAISGNGSGTVTITGSQSAINATLANASGLTYLGNLNFNGTDRLTISSNDLGNTGAGGALADVDTVAITVNAVNDAPSFVPGASQTVAEDAGPQIVAGWASGITAGPNESGQSLSFTTTVESAWASYASGQQHSGQSAVPSQSLASIRWQTPVDLNPQYSGEYLLIHYGSPLVTAANTVIVPVKTGATNGFKIEGRDGANGALKWTQTTDYLLPPHSWVPSYSPTLTPQGRLYYAGVGGTIYYRDNVDANGTVAPTQLAFYGLANYTANQAAYDSAVFVDTPITSDSAGNIYFGFRVTGSTPLGLQSGIARITPNGTATYVSATAASGDAGLTKMADNVAPALSQDGSRIYVTVSSGNVGRGVLLMLDSTTLTRIASVPLLDPQTGNNALISDNSTSSPMVGPDGDVYFGVLGNPIYLNHYRGWLLHFSGDLSQTKLPGAFGWDITPSVVPASMVPSYTGSSSYLVMTKYNNYAGAGGDGVNKLAILDPSTAMTDPITGTTVMNEVLMIAGVTPDEDHIGSYPNAVREWCINTAVVDRATGSVLVNSEDGRLYRWNLASNTFTEAITLNVGIGQAYTPTLIGADGSVYAVNNATLYAVGMPGASAFAGFFAAAPTINPVTGDLTYRVADNVHGTFHVSVMLSDNGGITGGGSNASPWYSFTINVTETNDAPIGVNDLLPNIAKNSGDYTVSVASFLGNDSAGPVNESAQSLTIVGVGSAVGGTVSIVGTDVIFSPTANYSGVASFSYTLRDNGTTAGNTDPNTAIAQASFSIVGPPTVSIALNPTSLGENGGSSLVIATLSNPAFQDVTVAVSFSGTATKDVDYSASSTSLVILAGQTSGSITLSGIDDAIFEGSESIVVDIISVTNGTENSSQSVTATIIDGDAQPSVTLSLNGNPLAENSGTATVVATLSTPSTQPVTVNLGFAGSAIFGVDYSVSSTSIMIAAGETSALTTVTVLNDTMDETDEIVTIDASSVTGGVENASQQVVVTIVDDDLPLAQLRPLGLNHAFSVGGIGQDGAWGVDFDASGNSLMVGGFRETVDFDPGIGVVSIASGLSYAEDIFVAKYTPNGELIWAKSAYGPQGYDFVEDVRFDNLRDSFVIVGNFARTVDFDMGAGALNLTSAGGSDGFVAKYDTNGNVLSAFSIGGSGSDSVEAVRWDSEGNLLVAGYFSGTADFNPSAANASLTSTGGLDAFIAKYDTNGSFIWVRQFAGVQDGQFRGLAIDATDAVLATGNFSGSIDLDPTIGAQVVDSRGDRDAMNVKLNSDGSLAWGFAIGSIGDDRGQTIGVDSQASVYVSGLFSGTMDFDPRPAVYELGEASTATFVSKFNSDGILQWASRLARGPAGYRGRSLAIGSDDTIYLSAPFNNSGDDFDPGPGVFALSTMGDNDVSVTALTPQGEFLWAGKLGGAGRDNSGSLAINSSGTVYVVGGWGLSSPTGDFDPGPGSYVLTGPGGYDIFLAALSPAPVVNLKYMEAPSVSEASSNLSLIITLDQTSSQPTVVTLGSSGSATSGLDYSLPAQVTIPPGGTSAGTTLVILDDNLFEGNETVSIQLNTTSQGTAGVSREVAITILDNDPFPAVSLNLLGSPIAENLGVGYVIALLSNPSTQDVTVNLTLSGTATNNVDYSASQASISILAGHTSGSISLTSIDDTSLEGSESIIVDLTGVTNGTEYGTQSEAATILDDESTPSITISLAASSLAENGGAAIVRVALSNPATQVVTISLGFTGSAILDSDYSTSLNSIVILAGQTSGSITLSALDDLLKEGSENIVIDVASVVNGAEIGLQQVTASITDDNSDPFQLSGSALTLLGTAGDDTLAINYGSSTSSFVATVNTSTATFSASTITIDGGGGNDTFNVTLSSLADTASLHGKTGSVTSSNYAISFSNVETATLTGNSLDRATFNDPGVTSRFTFLPTHAIMDSAAAGFLDTVIGFGGYTGNGQGNNDSLSLYGNSSGQTLTASPAQVSMSVGTLSLVGNNMRNYYSYGQGGIDSATYNGTTAAEVLTSTPGYSIVSSMQTLQYFVGFRNVTANSGGGVDSAKMYDSAGSDTLTSSTTTARFFGTTFDYRANGYTRVYAYQSRGNDTATLTGTAGNDRMSGNTAFVILSTGPFIQQVFNFSTVIVNAGTGTDLATLDDSTGNDTLNASGGLAELIYGSGRKIKLNGFDTVTARGTAGGINRKNVAGTLAYVLRFTGTWV